MSMGDMDDDGGMGMPVSPPPVTATLTGGSVTEGDFGTTPLSFQLTFSRVLTEPVTVTLQSADGTATAGIDYQPYSLGPVSLPPGSSSFPIDIQVIGDTLIETNETFTLRIADITGATLSGTGIAVGTILNDDSAASPPPPPSSNTATVVVNGVAQQAARSAPDQFGMEVRVGGSPGDDVMRGSIFNDLMNGADGADAINADAGNDIIDGGRGSNFLTGGAGTDQFNLDGRGASGAAGTSVFSTITDFQDGLEIITVFGWTEGVSRMLTVPSSGAPGFEGATLHLLLDGDGIIDASITLTGQPLSVVQTTAGFLPDGTGFLTIR